MEEEKKKKKTKKKKGRQNKTTEDVAGSVGETASVEQNNVIAIEKNQCIQISGNADVQTPGVMERDVNIDRHHCEGANCVILEEKIKQLQNENDSYIEREASLEEKIKQLQNENDSCIEREASLEKKLIHLLSEKDSWLQKEASLEGKIKQLSNENALWNMKQASFEYTIKHLESEKDSWVLKENSTNEIIARLNEDNRRLHVQVKELEESRVSLLQENQHLMETISVLQSQLQHSENGTSFSASSAKEKPKHAFEDEDLNTPMEAGHALVEKPISENAQLVAKVNERDMELDQRSVTAALSSTVEFDPSVVMSETATVADMSEFSEVSVSRERMESFASNQVKDRRNSADNTVTDITAVTTIQMEESPESYEAGESEEIVQVPLDDKEVVVLESQALETDENASVPLSAAPLIGAPFRLISFVAKYVSGADLVNNKT